MSAPLTPPTGQALSDALVQAAESVERYLDQRLAANTRRAYQTDWRHFEHWCQHHNLATLPAAAGTVALYLASCADAGDTVATLTRRRAALKAVHEGARLPSPTDDPAIRDLMKGIRRAKGTAQAAKTAATVELVEAMVGCTPDSVAGCRDRALLLLGFAGALRRSELVALTVDDLSDDQHGLRVRVRRSKTDPDGEGQVVAIPYGSRLQPVAAVRAWLAVAAITQGPVFRRVFKNGRVGAQALSDKTVVRVVKLYARQIGRSDVEDFAGHSLRSGFVTSAAQHDANILKTAAQTRHKSLKMVQRYFHDAALFDNHAGEDFL